MRLRAARGAIRVPSDDGDALLGSTERLLSAVLQRNGIDPEDLVSIMFTATEDLRSAFPAEAARRMGLGRVPLMCAQEIPVHGSMPSIIRILLHINTDRSQREVVHVYLGDAKKLRPDVCSAQ